MRAGLGLVFLAPVVAAFAAVGCSSSDSDGSVSAASNLGSDAGPAPLTDLDLAKKAVALLNADGAKCNQCHTAGRDDIARWGDAYKAVKSACLDPALSLSPVQRIDCLRKTPTDPASPFSAGKLGLYSAGAALSEFQALFNAAYGADGDAKLKAFVTKAGMPAFNRPGFTQAEWDTIKQWADRGLPKLDDVLTEPGAFACEPNTSPELAAHMAKMKNDGWGARLADASTPMAMCGTATKAIDCIKSRPDITRDMGFEGTAQTLRELRKFSTQSSFWVRSSPDGRFASLGGSPSRIVDLNAPDTAAPVTADAPYDPGWFPNNDGFSFASAGPGGIRVCRTSVVLGAFASAAHKITFTEPSCTRIIDTVYQSVGAALDGSLYFMATGTHTNDSGDSSGPLSASFGASATTTLTPMYNDGTKYVPGSALAVKIANEGDQQMSPSNTLLITRFGQKANTAGYHIRTVTPHFGASDAASPIPSSLTVDTKLIGTVCLPGGKPQLSFDERFLAVHQYTDPNNNPQGLPPQSSNIFVNDIKTGKTVQVTKLAKNVRALYPHWRADGWLYFLVRDDNTNKETLVASDVALRIAE